MNREEIEKLLESAYSKAEYDYLFLKAEKEQAFFNCIWEISEDMPDSRAWRLLWILDHATEKNNTFIFPILDKLYQNVIKTKNESYIRQGMKLLMRCPIIEKYITDLLDLSIEWMNNQKAKISTQAFGLEFFYQVCKIYPEMAPELVAYIDDILERSPSAGYRIRLNQIREALLKANGAF
ncbi:MAG: hypothetical protein JW798_11780 [Prolixibacteraceae bacterium]|nr:hypothetical protein [Prolixibacteraceae bacterium]